MVEVNRGRTMALVATESEKQLTVDRMENVRNIRKIIEQGNLDDEPVFAMLAAASERAAELMMDATVNATSTGEREWFQNRAVTIVAGIGIAARTFLVPGDEPVVEEVARG